MNPTELDELIGLLLDDQISEEKMDRLIEIVRHDSEALTELRSQLAIADRLSQYEDQLRSESAFLSAVETHLEAADSSQQFVSNVLDSTKKMSSKNTAGPNWFLLSTSIAIGALAASLLFLLFYSPVSLTNDPMALEVPMDNGVAVLTRAVDAVWESEESPEVGATISPQKIILSSGLVQIEFYSGASVLLEGPAQLEILDAEKAVCHYGKVRARVPQQAQGFTILSPGVELVDLGTEFGMDVSQDGNTMVQVFEGKVELYDLDSNRDAASRRELVAGEAVEVAMAGQTKAVEASETSFVSIKKLDELETQAKQQRFQKWVELSQKIKDDPRTIAYYGFEPESANSRTLDNQSTVSEEGLDGAIVGCSWATGRWPEKQALEFKRPSDRVRLNIPGEYDSLTYAAWVRVDGLDRRFNTLLLTDRFDPGEAHWQINREGKMILGIKNSDGDAPDYRSPPVIRLKNLGQWIHLSTVYDSKKRMVTHYLNGESIFKKKIETLTKLKFGKAEIGNWGKPMSGSRATIRNFNGRIDELMIFNDALADNEIRSMYNVGRP